MLGIFQTDPLECEFGIYRQRSGGNYYIGVEQIISSAHFRKLQLYNRLNISDDEHSSHSLMSCCDSEFDETESLMMDMIIEEISNISENEKSVLFFICGYIAFKENISNDRSSNHGFECEFTHLVNRGKLSFSLEDLFQFSMYAFTLTSTFLRDLVRYEQSVHFSKSWTIMILISLIILNPFVHA